VKEVLRGKVPAAVQKYDCDQAVNVVQNLESWRTVIGSARSISEYEAGTKVGDL